MDGIRKILRWPVREILLRYVFILKKQALQDYRFAIIQFCLQVPHVKDPASLNKPSIPEILR